MRSEVKLFTKNSSNDSITNITNLKFAANELHQEILNLPDDSNTVRSIQLIEDKIEELERQIAQGTIMRSRAKWIEEGKKNSRYFMSLEKRNSMSKTMYRLRRMDGSIITEQKLILKEQCKFYQELYYEHRDIHFDIKNESDIEVSLTQNEQLWKDITLDEIHDALFSMPNEKSPGTDGLPAEFYKYFWTELKDKIFDLYLCCIHDKELNRTARQGIISLLPKGKKDPLFPKNWRPLTLLNPDYKILAHLLALHLKVILPTIVGEQQTGFLPKRQITDNIVKTMDVIAYANAKKKKILIVTVDFEVF